MQKINQKNNTYMGMAFLFLSLAITPLSLKAVGISVNLSAGLAAWRQVSSVFGDNHQPVTSSELLALNNLNSGEDSSAGIDNAIEQTLIARLQGWPADALASHGSQIGLQPGFVENHQKRCARAASRAMRTQKGNEIALAVPVETGEANQEAWPVVTIDRKAIKNIEMRFAQQRFEFGEAMKILPVKDLKVMAMLKGLSISLPSGVSRCDFLKALSPEQLKEIRLKAGRARAEVPSPSAPENCEL